MRNEFWLCCVLQKKQTRKTCERQYQRFKASNLPSLSKLVPDLDDGAGPHHYSGFYQLLPDYRPNAGLPAARDYCRVLRRTSLQPSSASATHGTVMPSARYTTTLMIMSIYGSFGAILSWVSTSLPRPSAKRAVAYAFLNAMSNLASIYASYFYPAT